MLDNDPRDSENARWIAGFLKFVFFLFLALMAIWIGSSFVGGLFSSN